MSTQNEYEDLIIDVTPSSQYALKNGSTHLYVQLKITGVHSEEKEQRTNMNLGVVLDRSGSMHGSKLQKSKEAIEFIVNNLTNEDQFALTIYDHRVDTIIPSSKLINPTSIISRIRSIRDRGRTNLHGGLMEGFKQVKNGKLLEYRNILLLLSDGLANEGITDRTRMCESVKNIYEGGIGISTFGVGDDFDEDLMVDIADNGGGHFYFIQTADDIPKYIEQEFSGLLTTTAYNIEVEWENLDVKLRRVLGIPYQDRYSNNIRLGDLRSGNEILVILDIDIPPSSDREKRKEILKFKIKWIPRKGSVTPIEAKIPCTITYTTDETFLSIEDEHVIENVHLLETAFIQYEVMRMADRGDFKGALRVMEVMQEKLKTQVAQTGSINLQRLHQQNALMMDEVLNVEKYDRVTRKQLRSSMYELRKRR
ncbi:MAG: VWA domain-containing protein [Candidatus Hodarchaeota archaeon]